MPEDPLARLTALLARARGSPELDERRTCALLFLEKVDQYGFEIRVLPKEHASAATADPVVTPAPTTPRAAKVRAKAARAGAAAWDAVAASVKGNPESWLSGIQLAIDLTQGDDPVRAVRRHMRRVEKKAR